MRKPKDPSFFYRIFTDALSSILAAKEYSGFLPMVIDEQPLKRVTINIPKGSWKVFEELGEVLNVPPQVVFVALANASALAVLENIKESRNAS